MPLGRVNVVSEIVEKGLASPTQSALDEGVWDSQPCQFVARCDSNRVHPEHPAKDVVVSNARAYFCDGSDVLFKLDIVEI